MQTADGMEFFPQRQTVRVGFYRMSGYHEIAPNGHRYGYGYDYLHLIGRYTDWHYEYVGYEKGWLDMFAMLDAGQIDLITAAQKTPEREAKYIFSDKPMAYSSLMMTTLETNDKYHPGRPDTYHGMRVGLLRGNMRGVEFRKFAEENGINYTPVYYESVTEEENGLKSGEVDAIVTSSKRILHGEKILELRSPTPLYAVSTPDKKDIIRGINMAQYKLSSLDPGWEVALSSRYYAEVSGRMMALSPDSQAFLQGLKKSGRVFRVALMPNANPYAYFDKNGQAQGILPDIFVLIAKTAGIRYEIVPAANQAEYEALLKDKNTDIVLGMSSNFYEAEKVDYKLTQAILRSSIIQLSLKNEEAEGPIAMTANLKRKLAMVGRLPENVDQQDYDTPEEAVAALKAGKCSSVYMLGFIGEKYVNTDMHNSLRISIVPNQHLDMRLGIRASYDHRLFEVLSAAMPPVGSPAVQEIIYRHTAVHARELSWEELVYSYPLQFILLAILLVMIAGLAIITLVRNNAARQDEKRRQEVDAVMSYICRMHEMVVKVDLRTSTATEYHIDQDGRVFVDILPHNLERYINYLHPDDREKFLEGGVCDKEMHVAFQEKRIYYCEVRKQTEDNDYRFFSCRFQPYFQNGELVGFYFYRQDIDDERRKEITQREVLTNALNMARHASEAKGDFLSRMSHEIRTPLNAIIGYLTLGAQKNNTEEDLRQVIGKSQIAAHHLLGLINDILDLSSIERGKLQLAQEEFSLKDMVTEIQTIFNGQLQQKNITLTIDEQRVQHFCLQGDSLRIKQVLMNIFSNAVKFTPEGGSISLVMKQILRPNNVYITTFEITDSGIGMSKEYLENIFKPFEQESAKVARRYGGSGLGLAISQNLVKMMQGSIEVRSTQGEGTSFYVSLPLQGVQELPEAAAGTATEEISFDGVRLLLVEDNEMNREISETILEQHGFVIDTAVDGQDAVDKFMAAAPGTYKAILMDVQMPVLDGYGATQAIRRSNHPEAASIPIIAVTADVFTDDVARVMSCGMNDYLSKPIDFDKLIATLRKYM
ncbi:Signal transduction histidine kinase [Selenomonas ruminantium]|uniref:Circadian input-output histidine kinase CikA n=1 Tax=Selenomonas ruminantium TaxID=971 RepID=A0A1M6XDQ6_SELRU|nr:transporter substrate-binding domain-containing protein [Selenomonas ruminantium]SHL04107.1 Signal transduction histidine kinase [Selenomonas ruminantium]